MKLWVVGIIKDEERPAEWEIVGVFDSESLADAACRTRLHFMGEIVLNQDIGDPTLEWPKARYPRATP